MRLNPSALRADAGAAASARDWFSVFLGTGLGAATMVLGSLGCSIDPSGASPISFTPHCGDEQGDTTCALLAIGRPYCDLCRPASANQGCASQEPSVPACRVGGGLGTTTFTTGDDGSSTSDVTTLETLGSDSTTMMADSGSETGSSSSGGPVLPCDSPDGAFDGDCDDADSTRPYCVAQSCVSCATAGGSDFCGAADVMAPACSADTGRCSPCEDVETFVCGQEFPVCDASGACLPCAAHAACESGACHLDPSDPRNGECFLVEETIYVDEDAVCPGDGTEATPNCSLADAVGGVLEGESRALRVAPGDYPEAVVFAVDATVALVGNGGVPALSGDSAGAPGLSISDGRVYLRGIRVSNNVAAEGIACSNATLWMEGSEVGDNADYGIFTTGPCALRLKASTVFNNAGGGLRVLGGSLVLDNAAVGNNGNGARGPGINAVYTTLDVLYSTIAGNDGVGADSLQCFETQGAVRNSIVVGANTNSAALDCFSLDFSTTAIDSGSFAGNGGLHVVTPYNPLWFNDADGGDFRLGAPPLTPFGDVALWLEGDPLLDADGTPRPIDGTLGYAGADEP